MTPHDPGRRGGLAVGPVHILLVEDDDDQRELTVEALSGGIPDTRITVAKDGASALEAVRTSHPDLVLLDYNLPGMSGLDILRQINKENSTVPVIMVTGQGDERVAVETMKNGAHDYIIKTRNYHDTLPITVERAIRESWMKRELQEASLRGRRLYELSLSVAKERKADVLSERLVKGAAMLVGTDKAMVYLVDSCGSVAFVKMHGIDIDPRELMGPVSNIGLLGAAYAENRPIVVERPQDHSAWDATPRLNSELRQMLAVPLSMQGRVEGVLCVLNKLNRKPFSQEDVDTLSTLAVHAGVAIDNARFVERIKQQAVTDSLTGLYNHMEFQKQLTKDICRSRRFKNELSLLILDLDHFKLVNDTYGHQVGDAVLREIAHLMGSHLRAFDKVFRYGGEEFAIILPQTSTHDARLTAERIRHSIAQRSYGTDAGHGIEVTISIGVATFPHDAQGRKELIGTADQALFAAKRAGRNRIELYGEPTADAGSSVAGHKTAHSH